MNISIKDIKNSIYHPEQIKYLYSHTNIRTKKIITRVLSNLVREDFGIEFELFGCIPSKLIRKNYKGYLINGIQVMDFSQDYDNYDFLKETSGSLNEIRIRFNGYRQLKSLHDILNLIKKYCKIPNERGGIHIHINIKDWLNFEECSKDSINRLSKLLADKIPELLMLCQGYSGNYNKRGCGIFTKGKYINISSKNSIEFRILRLTFDYNELIRIIIGLQRIVKNCKDNLSRYKPSIIRDSCIEINTVTNQYDDDYVWNNYNIVGYQDSVYTNINYNNNSNWSIQSSFNGA